MKKITSLIVLILLLASLPGCVVHFKAKELELETERQRVEVDRAYQLEKVVILNGRDHRG